MKPTPASHIVPIATLCSPAAPATRPERTNLQGRRSRISGQNQRMQLVSLTPPAWQPARRVTCVQSNTRGLQARCAAKACRLGFVDYLPRYYVQVNSPADNIDASARFSTRLTGDLWTVSQQISPLCLIIDELRWTML